MDLEASKKKVEALTAPRNAVLVGASDRPGSWSARVWHNLHRYQFPGAVYLINPRRNEIWGTPCYPDFKSLPEPPDHMVVLVPAAGVIETLRGGAAAGARSATVFSAGFGEGFDAEAAALGRELAAVIAETGLGVSYLSQSTSSEESLSPMLGHYLATSGSDGLCIGSKRHPRTYGSFARVLGEFVRERKAMPLEDAVRKMTSACALRLGLKDRGLVREGFIADLAVWDPATINDRSTYAEPLVTAVGVSHVLVSGKFVLDNGAHTGATPGRALKPLLA